MTTQSYPSRTLTEICEQLLDDYGLTLEQIANFAKDIPGECQSISDDRNERAWEAYQSREPDDSSYRRDMINAGRGHLLR